MLLTLTVLQYTPWLALFSPCVRPQSSQNLRIFTQCLTALTACLAQLSQGHSLSASVGLGTFLGSLETSFSTIVSTLSSDCFLEQWHFILKGAAPLL